jgi:hypothetical protein
MKFCIFSVFTVILAIRGNAQGTCPIDEMDLCPGNGQMDQKEMLALARTDDSYLNEMDLCNGLRFTYGAYGNDCGLDEMDLCPHKRSFDLCDEDEMDLCPGTARACADDEMDLCDNHGICDDDEMDLCQDTTTTTTTVTFVQPVSIQATFNMNAPGATQSQVETAVRRAVANMLNIPEARVTEVTATQSRRLSSTINGRQLQAGWWFVGFKVQVEASVGDIAMNTIESLETDLTPFTKELKDQFYALGLVDTAMGLTVQNFFGAILRAEDLEETALAVSMYGKYSVAFALLLATVMAPDSKYGGLIGAISGPSALAQ